MKKYFLDTSVIIEYLRGSEMWVKIISGLDGEAVSSYVCLAEMYEGIARDTRKESEARVLGFFKSLSSVYEVDGKVAECFGKLRVELRKSGNLIEDMDLLVAAICLSMGLTLVTVNNKHFGRIPRLEMYRE